MSNTESIKYIGAKTKLLDVIVEEIIGLSPSIVLDGFSGSSRVSQGIIDKSDIKIIANDLGEWAYCLAVCYLMNTKKSSYYHDKIEYLNKLKPVHGWYTENYGGVNGEKKPFSINNTMKLDAIRDEIDSISDNEIEKHTLITSLILALDKCDSTLGHQVSYISKWPNRAFNHIELKVPNYKVSNGENEVYNMDIFKLFESNIKYNVAYFDPPYGSSNNKMPSSRVRYNAYYHIWKSIVLNDKPQLFGKCNRRIDSKDTENWSIFEEYRQNENGIYYSDIALNNLIKQARCEFVMLSYNNNGRTNLECLMDIVSDNGEIVSVIDIEHKRNVMSNMKWTNEWVNNKNTNREYIITIKK